MSRAVRVVTALAVVGLGAIGFLPLFGGPGYEAALAAGAILPGLAAVLGAREVLRERLLPQAAFVRGATSGAWLGAVGLAVTWLHGLRAGLCDAREGTELFLLGPAVGAVAAGVWGAFLGLALPFRPKMAMGLALLGPLGGIFLSLVRFYTSPMVFAFDPFFGFFAGALYDSVITGVDRLGTYRLGTGATLLAAFAAASLVDRTDAWRLTLILRGRLPALVVALSAGAASLWHAARGPALGHYQTLSSISEALGGRLVSGRCEIVYPRGTPEVEAQALGRECDGHLGQLEAFFGVRGPERVTVLVFASASQKGYLMGAATTYIAKPWRREIYIQRAGFPHPVLRHELAHVVAGAFGQGPFEVAGPLGGLIPDPGRIEGVAVAAAPRDDDLTLAEWARAMRDLKLLPNLRRVFKLSFLGEPSSRAYVVAGAFIDWLRRERGVSAVRRWYAGETLEAAAGGDLASLEREWHRSLDAVVVTTEGLEAARVRFDRPAIFGRRCPHIVDRLAEEAGAALGQLDTVRARKIYGELLALDPHDLGARTGLAQCDERDGHVDRARARYVALAKDPGIGRAAKGRATESLGDLALEAGAADEARRHYDEVAKLVVDSDRIRTLDVKRWAATAKGREAILAHLFGDPRLGRDPNHAAASLGAWSAREPELGMANYLLGRTYIGAGRWQLAAESLDLALGRDLPLPSVVREARRLRLIVACALGDRVSVGDAHAQWAALESPKPAERVDIADLVERCTGARPAAPATEGQATAPASTSPIACPEGMARIPSGEAWIGSPRGDHVDDEWPRYRTRFAAFCLDHTEVTVDAYRKCVDAGACKPADRDRVTCTASGDEAATYPVNCVDWREATAFCRSRQARLPTEAEWEYAASGGDDREYSWGSQSPDDRACWKTNGACPVGRFPPGAFDLLDMTGNLWEWTSDGYGDYPFAPVDSPNRVYRGGGWSRRFDKWMRVRLRNRGAPDFRGSHLGFRCASTLPDVPCPFGRAEDGTCLHGVLVAECRPEKRWNGIRCAFPGDDGCGEGKHAVPGHGCVHDGTSTEPEAPSLDLASVQRSRSPEFDVDCAKFQNGRPSAYRFEGSTHDARNRVARDLGCKNRDVGAGWNSACCP